VKREKNQEDKEGKGCALQTSSHDLERRFKRSRSANYRVRQHHPFFDQGDKDKTKGKSQTPDQHGNKERRQKIAVTAEKKSRPAAAGFMLGKGGEDRGANQQLLER